MGKAWHGMACMVNGVGQGDERAVSIGWGKMHFMQWKIIGSK